MEISRLKEFIVLAQCLNYSKAANLLFLTQPVLSRHIHDLEESVGARFFVRNTHKVELTPIGELAYREFTSVIDSYDIALKNIKQAADLANGSISVGFLGYAVKPFITQFIQAFSAQHPKIQVTYVASDLDDLIKSVSNDSLDVAFISHIEADMFRDFEIRHIADDHLSVVVPFEHPLSGREQVSLADMSDEPLITFRKDTNPIAAMFHEKMFDRYHISMKSIRTVSTVESGISYAHMGVGCFIIPQHLTSMASDMQIIPFSDEGAKVSLHLVWKRSNEKTGLKTFIHDFTNFYNDWM